MDFQNIVLPYEPSLIESLEGRDAELIVHVGDVSEIVPAADDVLSSRNRLGSIVARTDRTLDLLDFSEEWEGIPVTLYSPGPGSFRDLQRKYDLVHRLNLRPFFPADGKEAVVGLQTLASTGLQCGVDFNVDSPNWDALIDLATYVILMTTSHAEVEPFSYLVEKYDPHDFNDWSSAYFDDPNDFLHLDSRGRPALTYADLAAGKFIAENISGVDAMEVCERLEEEKRAWRRYFLENLPCSTCEGWRVCLGKFERLIDESGLCPAAPFFTEMLDILDQKYFEIDNRENQPQQEEAN
jgi:hypothetical protein